MAVAEKLGEASHALHKKFAREYVPACGVVKETQFSELSIKGRMFRDVLNLEARPMPNGWGPAHRWLFFPGSDFLNAWDSCLALLVIYVAIMVGSDG